MSTTPAASRLLAPDLDAIRAFAEAKDHANWELLAQLAAAMPPGAVRTQLGDERFEAAWAEGRERAVEASVTAALGESEEPVRLGERLRDFCSFCSLSSGSGAPASSARIRR